MPSGGKLTQNFSRALTLRTLPPFMVDAPPAGVLRARVVGGPGGTVRAFKAVIQFLGKIGEWKEEGVVFAFASSRSPSPTAPCPSLTPGPDLLIEAFPDRCTLRALNASQSAYAAATLPAPFFAGYEVFNEAAVRAAVPAKHVLAALRGGRADSVALELAPALAEASVTVTSDTGLTKRFRVAALDATILNATVDEASLTAGFVAPPGELGTLLASLGGGPHATLAVGPPPLPGAGGHATVELASWMGPAGGASSSTAQRAAAPSARLQLGGGSASLRCVRAPPRGARVTLSSRDLRALLPLCDALAADVDVAFGGPGRPARAASAPREGGTFGGDGATPDVILVLATQQEEDEGEGVPSQQAAPPAPQPRARVAAAAPPPAAAPAPVDPYAFQGTPGVTLRAAAAAEVPSSEEDEGGDAVDDGDASDGDGDGVAATPPDQMPAS